MDTTPFEIKDSITVEGITADHVWYNANLLTRNMSSWADDFQKLVNTMEARHKEHLKIIEGLLVVQSALKREVATLKSSTQG
jgi:hypothetical protein